MKIFHFYFIITQKNLLLNFHFLDYILVGDYSKIFFYFLIKKNCETYHCTDNEAPFRYFDAEPG